MMTDDVDMAMFSVSRARGTSLGDGILSPATSPGVVPLNPEPLLPVSRPRVPLLPVSLLPLLLPDSQLAPSDDESATVDD